MRLVLSVLFLGVILTGCPSARGGDGGVPGADGGTGGESGQGGGGGTVTADGGLAFAPQLTSVAARVGGRTGRDLVLAVKGKDRNLDAITLWVRLMDAQGGAVVGIDANRDGRADATEGPLTLEGKKWVGEVVTATATVRGLFTHTSGVTKVGVMIVDAASLRSDELVVSVNQQPVLARGEACDPLFVENRCEAGLGCRGTPSVCDEGLAPEITRMAFYRSSVDGGTGSPTILVEGTEPEDDLSSILFQFQNAQGQPVSIDSDGDGTPDMTSFTQDVLGLAVDGTFFLRMQSGQDLDKQVPKLVATASDVAGHAGASKTATPSTIPQRSAGQTCDARGFDTCGPNLSCSPGALGAVNTCANAFNLRTAQCSSATILVPTATGAKIVGIAEGGSLWDAPSGCSTNDPTGRPEGIVKLRLTSRADTITLSTIGPGTTFDTALYLLPGCPNDTTNVLGCSDDFPGAAGASQLVLTDMPAGDYLVVIDSFDFIGGSFELTATVE